MHLSHIAFANRLTVALVLATSLLRPVLAAPQVVWTGLGPEGGTITALAIDPQTPDTLYAGTMVGGVFKSVDGGNSWHAVNTGLTDVCTRSAPPYSTDRFCFQITALAIDQLTPTTLYAGTWFRGVFKSTNGGTSWSALNIGRVDVHSLVIDPRTPTTLYVGGCEGVFKSTDGGVSWHLLNAGLTGNPCFTVLAIDPQASSTLYAATMKGGVNKTTDGGANWRPVNTGLSSPYVTSLVIDPQTPTNIYAGVAGIAGLVGGVAKSIDGGESWSEVVKTGLTLSEGFNETPEVQVLAIDARTPTTLFAGVGGPWPAILMPGGLFKSTDAGKSWRAVAGDFNLSRPGVYAFVVDYQRPNIFYAGVAIGGVLKSADGGAIWHTVNAGLTKLDLQSGPLAIDPQAPTTVYVGTNGGVFKSTDRGRNWRPVNSGLGWVNVSALAIDSYTPTIVYAGTLFGVFKSTDGGGNWRPINAGLTHHYVATLVIDPQTPTIIYVGLGCGHLGARGVFDTPGGVFKSTDAGVKWVAINTGLPDMVLIGGSYPTDGRSSMGSVNKLAIDPQTPTTIYASVMTCELDSVPAAVYKSANGGTTWDRPSRSTFAAGALAIDPRAPEIIYATGDTHFAPGGGILKSTDAGRTWHAINTGLTNVKVYAVAIDPQTPTTIYAGTGSGVFKSTDGGDSWRALNAGLSDLAVIALAIDPKTPSTLYAATSDGVFVLQQ